MADVTCSECGYTTEINCDDLDWDSTGEGEGGMGPRVSHSATWEDRCPECSANMSTTFECSEYPVGVIEDSQVTDQKNCDTDGCCCPDVSFKDYDDDSV